MEKVKSFFVALFQSLVMRWIFKVTRDTAAIYMGANGFQPTKAWAYGLGAAVLSALFHGAEIYLDSVGKTSSNAVPLQISKPAVGLWFLLCFLLVGQVGAWDLPSNKFGLEQPGKLGLTVTGQSENDLVLLPTASLGFGVGPGNVPSYGYSGAWDLVFGKIAQGSEAGKVSLTPYFGVGGAVYVDLGPFVSSGGRDPVKADGGLNVIGPQINGLVPSAMLVWNFETGEKIQTVNLTAPFDLFSDAAIFKVLGL